MADGHKYYTVFDLLEQKGKDALQEKLDAQIRENPSLSGVTGATNARLKPESQWRIISAQSWLPDPVEAPLRINEELIKTARPEFTLYGMMYKPYAQNAVVYDLDSSPAPMAVEMEIRLEAVVEAYNIESKNDNGKVAIYTRTLRFILPARLDMKQVSLKLGSLEPDRPFSTAPGRIYMDEHLLLAKWDAQADDLLARRMLLEFMPECLYYPLPVDPYELVRRMGLQLIWKLLSQDFGILGEIFDHKCKTHIIEIYSREDNENYWVDSGTILIDNRLRTGNHYPMEVIHTTLIHECVHWYKDRLFIALQNVFSPQVCLSICRNSPAAHRSGLFEPEESSSDDLNLNVPSDLMEAQALAIPPHIMINAESGRKKVAEIINGFGGRITPENYYSIIDEMRHFFGVTRYAADKRLREFGYKIPPLNRSARRFTYKRRADSGIVYDISFDRLVELFDEEKYTDYCRLLKTGRFIHADYRLCLNSDEYIEFDAVGVPHLTALARSNPSKCCIPFRIAPVKDPDLGTGAMATARPKQDINVAVPEPSPDLEERTAEFNALTVETDAVAEMKFGEEMEYHRKHPVNTTFMEWAVSSFVSEKRLKSLCKDPVRPKPEYNILLRAMLALHLGPWYTLPLIQKAKVDEPEDPKHQRAILVVLSCDYKRSVLEIHKILLGHNYRLIEPNMLKKNELDEKGDYLLK